MNAPSFLHKSFALLLSASLAVGLIPTGAFASGEQLSTTPLKNSYYVGEEVPFIFERGDLVGTVHGQLSSENGGEFSDGTVSGTCSTTFSETHTATIASSANRKAFCFRATAAGVETISLFIEESEEVLVQELTIVDLPLLQYNEAGEVRICQFVDGGEEPYLGLDFPVDNTGQLADGQTGTSELALQNIIPPFEYLNAAYEIETYEGRNWDIANRVIYNNSCALIDTDIEGCTNEIATNYNPFASIDDGTCEYVNVCEPGFGLNETLECVPEVAQVCEFGENLIKNGSFEDPIPDANAFGGGHWEVFASIPYWSATQSIELWRNMFGGAKDGFQNVELDVVTSTTISQQVETLPGALYELRFGFSPRVNTGSNDNQVRVLANNQEILLHSDSGVGNANNSWDQPIKVFLASTTETIISFADAGTSNGLGTLIDDVVLCKIADPVYGCTDEEATNFLPEATVDDASCVFEEDVYIIEGYVWHDDNRNAAWEGVTIPTSDTETPLTNWTVTATKEGVTYATTTDKNGFYELAVPAGTYEITVVMSGRWRIITDLSYTVTVPTEPPLLTKVWQVLVPVAHAAVLGRVGPYNFGLDTFGSGGNSVVAQGVVSGVSTSTIATPLPLILGEQVSKVPIGAPHTGQGSTPLVIVGTLLAVPQAYSRRSHKR